MTPIKDTTMRKKVHRPPIARKTIFVAVLKPEKNTIVMAVNGTATINITTADIRTRNKLLTITL